MPEISFLLDANMPRSSLDVLEKEGFEAEDVRDIGMGSARDDEIIERARREGQIIVTRDTDFGSVLRHPDHPGALILRLPYTFTAQDITSGLRASCPRWRKRCLRTPSSWSSSLGSVGAPSREPKARGFGLTPHTLDCTPEHAANRVLLHLEAEEFIGEFERA